MKAIKVSAAWQEKNEKERNSAPSINPFSFPLPLPDATQQLCLYKMHTIVIQPANHVAAAQWMKSCSYRTGNVHIRHQNSDKMWSQWVTLTVPDRLVWVFQNLLSTCLGVFDIAVYRIYTECKNKWINPVRSRQKHFLWEMSEENDQTGAS